MCEKKKIQLLERVIKRHLLGIDTFVIKYLLSKISVKASCRKHINLD